MHMLWGHPLTHRQTTIGHITKKNDFLSPGGGHQLPIAPQIGVGPWRPGPFYAGILPALVLGRLPQPLCVDESTSPWPEVGTHRSPPHLLALSYHFLPEVPCTLEDGRLLYRAHHCWASGVSGVTYATHFVQLWVSALTILTKLEGNTGLLV